MGGHGERGSSKEDAERTRHLPRERSPHREKSRRSKKSDRHDRDSKESRRTPEKSHEDANQPLRELQNVNNDAIVMAENHAAVPTGPTRDTPRDDALPGTSSDTSDRRLDELYAMFGTMVEKINSLDKSADHDMSDSDHDEDEPGHDGDRHDPMGMMDNLSAIFAQQGGPDDDENNDNDFDLAKAIAEFSGGFASKEEKGEPLHDAYAAILNDSLRSKPNDSVLKPMIQAVKIPANVPNLAVPQTNSDITKAMTNNGKLLDSHLSRTLGMISKAIVPLAQLVAEVGEGKPKSVKQYSKSVNSSILILAASFNYINQTRKEIVRMHVREQALTTLCKWDSPVGTDELFPFDVTKKCDELGKVRTLGSGPSSGSSFGSSFGKQFKRFSRKPNASNDFKWPPRRFDKPPSAPYANNSNNGKGKTGKPFLGKKSQDRHRKRY